MTTLKRRAFIGAIAALGAHSSMQAQTAAYPSRPIKLVVGFAAGGPTDLVARAMANDMSQSLGQQVVVENRPGATGRIATESVARAPGDGYTLLIDSQTLITNPLTMSKVLYDPLRDFVTISRLVSLPLIILVGPDHPAKTVKDLVQMAKAKPGQLNYGSAGVAGSGHLAGALLSTTAGVEMTHIPFKGQQPALTEVMSGRIDFIFYAAAGAREQVAGKRVKALAVTTRRRLEQFPDVPTMEEAGFGGFETTTPWLGMVAPAGTPPDVVKKLNETVRQSMAKPAMLEQFRRLAAIPVDGTPAEFRTFLEKDYDGWKKLISTTGIKVEE
jgi:tripartite-type tricarboxylate transporter receptor subunit TctC